MWMGTFSQFFLQKIFIKSIGEIDFTGKIFKKKEIKFMGNNTIDNSFVTRNASGLYEVRIPNQPTAVFSSENQAIDFAKRKTNNLSSHYIQLVDDGTYQVKYGNEPARVFSNEAQAKKYLENLILNKQTPQPIASTPIIGMNANGLHEVKLPGMPARVFQQEADAKAFLNNSINELKQTSIKQAANGYEVKLPGQPARLFNNEADAMKFFNKQLGIDDLADNVQHAATTPKVKTKSTGFFSKVGKAMKGKKGKVALIAAGAAALIGGGIALFGGKKDEEVPQQQPGLPAPGTAEPDKPVVTPENPTDTVPEQPTPVVTQPQPEPEPVVAQEPEYDEYTVKKGDHFWGLAKQELIEAHKDDPNYKPSDKEILELAEQIIKDNKYGFDDNHWYSDPMLMPGDKIRIRKVA